MNLSQFIEFQREWSTKTFGPGQRTEAVLKHIAMESDEVRANPKDVSEWCDIIILAIDGAWRATGASADDICNALISKQKVNATRVYPFPTSPDEPSEHIR